MFPFISFSKVDLLIDWKDQRVTVYVNQTQQGSNIFFTKADKNVDAANALALYNLSPNGHCVVENMKMCEELCDVGYEVKFAFAQQLTLAAGALIVVAASVLA